MADINKQPQTSMQRSGRTEQSSLMAEIWQHSGRGAPHLMPNDPSRIGLLSSSSSSCTALLCTLSSWLPASPFPATSVTAACSVNIHKYRFAVLQGKKKQQQRAHLVSLVRLKCFGLSGLRPESPQLLSCLSLDMVPVSMRCHFFSGGLDLLSCHHSCILLLHAFIIVGGGPRGLGHGGAGVGWGGFRLHVTAAAFSFCMHVCHGEGQLLGKRGRGVGNVFYPGAGGVTSNI